MEKLLRKMGFDQQEIDRLNPEIAKFLIWEHDLNSIKKDIKTIKVSLILLVTMVGFLLVS